MDVVTIVGYATCDLGRPPGFRQLEMSRLADSPRFRSVGRVDIKEPPPTKCQQTTDKSPKQTSARPEIGGTGNSNTNTADSPRRNHLTSLLPAHLLLGGCSTPARIIHLPFPAPLSKIVNVARRTAAWHTRDPTLHPGYVCHTSNDTTG